MNAPAKKVLTPYQQLFNALCDAGARCLSQMGSQQMTHKYTLEFWSVPTPKPGRLVVVQHWLDADSWDAYVPITSHKTAEAIAEVLNGDGMREALQGLFENCAMVHKHWGEGSNQQQSDEALKAARAALGKATS